MTEWEEEEQRARIAWIDVLLKAERPYRDDVIIKTTLKMLYDVLDIVEQTDAEDDIRAAYNAIRDRWYRQYR